MTTVPKVSCMNRCQVMALCMNHAGEVPEDPIRGVLEGDGVSGVPGEGGVAHSQQLHRLLSLHSPGHHRVLLTQL